MTDRELLEKAAKAAGKTNWQARTFYSDARCDSEGVPYWNPLTDDGDALRLAVKLGLEISVDDYQVIVTSGRWFEREVDVPGASVPRGGDDYAATRRAIVRAAAAMSEE